MTTDNGSREELLAEMAELRHRLSEAEETLHAIQSGGVDALVISRQDGEHIYTLQGAEHPYRVLVESMHEGAVTLSRDGDILYCNKRLACMLQVPLEKLFGTRLASYIAPADRPLFAELFERGSIECDKQEITLITASRDSLPVLFSCCRIDLSGSAGMSVVLTDMSYKKQTEAKLREAQIQARVAEERERAADALRESEQRFRLLFESSPDAVLLTVPDGTVLAANPAACAIFGMSQEELSKTAHEALADPDDPRHAAVVEKRRGTGRILKAECGYVRKNGERFTAEVDSVILSDNPPRSFVILRDITERKRAEEELRQAHDRLELRVQERTAELRQKDQMLLVQGRQAAMGEMIGNIAHQWRQPLNALGLTIQQLALLQEVGELDGEALEKNVETAMDLIQHMSETIDDFRNYFKPDKKKANFTLSGAVAKTVTLIQDSFKNNHIGIRVAIHGDQVVFGYRNQFAQALLNILNNARDAFSERGIGKPEVTITVGEEDGKAILTVADNAGGIPEEFIEKIFDPYFTTKGPQLGTGVGLYMSKSIIEKNMGGKLSARNTSLGVEFRIEV